MGEHETTLLNPVTDATPKGVSVMRFEEGETPWVEDATFDESNRLFDSSGNLTSKQEALSANCNFRILDEGRRFSVDIPFESGTKIIPVTPLEGKTLGVSYSAKTQRLYLLKEGKQVEIWKQEGEGFSYHETIRTEPKTKAQKLILLEGESGVAKTLYVELEHYLLNQEFRMMS